MIFRNNYLKFMHTTLVVLLDKLLIQCYHKIGDATYPNKHSPKLYVATILEYLDPSGIVSCLLVIKS